MKKFLLTALSIMSLLTASAGIEGTYVVEKYQGQDVGDKYTFASGESWESEPGDETWSATIAAADNGTYVVTNLIGWAEDVTATYDEATGILSIAPNQEVYLDESGYYYYTCGGFAGYTTSKEITDYCDAQSGWIINTLKLKDIQLKLEDGILTAITPILIYIDYYPGYGYWGSASSIYNELVLKDEASSVTPGTNVEVAGTYRSIAYAGCEIGANYKFSSGEQWDSSDATDEDMWDMVVTKGEEDAYTVSNLLGWDEQLQATFDAETGRLSIAPNQLVYTDEQGYDYYISGGIKGYDTPEAIMEYCDSQAGWLPATKALTPIEIAVDEETAVLKTPVLVYIDYYPGSGYWGSAYMLYTSIDYVRVSGSEGIHSVEASDVDAPAEYYNMQGMRLANPAHGQIIIVRQGGKISKMIVR